MSTLRAVLLYISLLSLAVPTHMLLHTWIFYELKKLNLP